MSYHDNHYSGYSNGYNDLKEFWEKEHLVARDNHCRYSLRKADDHYFWTEDWCEDDKGNIIPDTHETLDDYKVVKMYHDGTIILNLAFKGRRGNSVYLNENTLQQIHHILPNNIHMFFTGGRKNPKTFLVWNPKENVRNTSSYGKSGHKPTTMWEVT